MRLERALCAVILIGLAGGCTSEEKAPPVVDPARTTVASAPPWTEPASYTFVLTRGCDPAAPLGRYRATVANGAVTAASRVGGAAAPSPSAEVDLGPVTGAEGEEIDVPALGELITMAETAKEDGAQVATEFDLTDGHPAKVTINVTDSPESAECWVISDYKA